MHRFITRFKGVERDLRLLWFALFCMSVGLGIYTATFFNFATERLDVQPISMGWLEFIREMPGLCCAFVAALTMGVAEPLLGSMAFFMVAIGLGAYAGVSSIHTLMFWSLVWSLGLHTWMPLQSSMVLSLAKEGVKGKRLGQTIGAGSLGTILGMVAVLVLGYRLSYQVWYMVAGLAVFIAAFAMLKIRRNIGHTEKPRFVVKKKYSLYYVLTFLEGCRKQVFFTFAVYALTKVYGTKMQTVALLMVINNLVNLVGAPVVGRMIDRIGERKILITSYSALILVFLGYAGFRHVHYLYVLYCLDNLFYLSTTCLTTYLQKMSEPEDLMPTLSVGVTMNHTGAVLVPLIGFYLWNRFSYPVTFYAGAVVVAISLVMAGKVGRKKPIQEAV